MTGLTENSLVSRSDAKLNWLQTFFIGLGFFTTGISWALYNSYLPLWLNTYIDDRWLVGFIMGLDNLAMVFMEPIVGTLSDRTNTRFGRRFPYLLIGIPLSALFLVMLPVVRTSGLLPLMAVVISFLLMMAFYRAPVVALMPDIVPSRYRSKANGVINLMGGLGAVYAFLFASTLYGINPLLAFGSTAVIMLVALVLLFFFVKEPEEVEALSTERKHSIIKSVNEVFIENKDKTGIFILFAIFFWFLGYNALETWFTSWATTTLPHIINIAQTLSVEKAEGSASFMLTVFSLVFVVSAIPAGYIGQRLGRAKTIKIGLPVLVFFLLTTWAVGELNVFNLEPGLQYYLSMIILGAGGIGWALININSIVIVWEIATDAKLGSYTGLYYLFSSSAAVTGPGIIGLIFDILAAGEFFLLFPVSIICFIVAFILMFGVKSGEITS